MKSDRLRTVAGALIPLLLVVSLPTLGASIAATFIALIFEPSAVEAAVNL